MPPVDAQLRIMITAQAEKLVARGDIGAAIRTYGELIARDPLDTNTLNRIGDLHVRMFDNAAAAEIFERVAKIHAADGHFLKAIAVYKKLNKLDPARLSVYESLAELYARQGLDMEARSQYQVLADYHKKHGNEAEAGRLYARIEALTRGKTPSRAAPVLTPAQSADPVAGLPIAGVPLIRTAGDMVVFLCHASEDKPAVRELYAKLTKDRYQPWLDEEDLLAGQNWEAEIKRAVRRSHVVLVCLSSRSLTKAGFLQKEIRMALDVLDEQPDGIIFVVPARLEECAVPESLRHLHYVDLFSERGYSKLCRSLDARAHQIGFVGTAAG